MSQIPAPAYIYQPLRFQDSIRLLKLYAGSRGSPLRCDIDEVRRCDIPKYEALSYAWGSAEFPHTIEEVVSGTHLSITLNLFTALQGIRYEHASRLLWIDAICINQKELKEKSHQVACMGKIYEDAWRVVVWLGSHKGVPERILIIMNEIIQCVQHMDDQSFLKNIRRLTQALLRLSHMHFFEQPWLKRVWVVQEFILARELQFMAAGDIIPFDLIYSVVTTVTAAVTSKPMEAVVINQHDVNYTLHTMGAQHILEGIRCMSQLFSYRDRRRSQQSMELSQPRLKHDLLNRSLAQCVSELSLDRECREVRDKIYGVLAVSANDLGMVADYELPLDVVCNDFATRSLLAKDLSLLHFSGVRPGHDHNFRSFVPHLTHADIMTYRLNAPGFDYCASINQPVSVCVTTGCLPSLRGVCVDTINRIKNGLPSNSSEFYDPYDHIRDGDPFSSEDLQHWLHGSRMPYTYPRSNGIGAWDLVRIDGRKRSQVQSDQWNGVRNCIRWGASLSAKISSKFAKSILKNRLFFQTEQGYIGLGPFWMRSGDQVVIYDGSVTPFIIRKSITKDQDGDTWQHVGDCYLHGWMDGDFCWHTVVEDLPSQEENAIKMSVGEETRYLVREWFTLV
ncbi:heterokaryon incompatibility protein-domain-containing protein [Phaeosphaeria sp. MPI-PUGE-AT-0046c]|nr:heterokaryon incompatibility protein-domain-containing protein [Phaeosphaeria sp. MPI-PUGE-AT-0046c]